MRIRDIIPVALEKREADVLIKNAKIVNVFSGKIEEGNIALFRKRIAGIGDYTKGKKVIDAKGLYVVPGLIDAHLHIESSMLSPRQFARAILLRGTTTIIADPHEITNVLGLEGLEYMIKATEGIPLNVYIAIPSAVPATNLETSGARLGAEDMVSIVEKYPTRVIALGEVMNFPGVLNLDRELITKIEILRHKYKKIDGHSPGLSGKELNAYIDAFIRSDHECTTKEEAFEKMSRGMQVFIREGTSAKDLDSLIGAVDVMNHHFFSFCTDDRDSLDILEEGHIDHLIRKSISKGVDPIIAIRMATINTARYFNLRSMGAISPGYKADMVFVEDLEKFNIRMVIKDSRVVVQDGEIVGDFKGVYNDLPEKVGRINLPKVDVEDIEVKPESNKMRVIKLTKRSLITEELIVEPKVVDGKVISDPQNDVLKVVVLDRHTGRNFSVGFIKGFGIKSGAVATSIGHDSHNVSVVGIRDEDMLFAVKEIERMNGGIVVVEDGSVLARLPLPVAGLMSNEDLYTVSYQLKKVDNALRKLGSDKEMLMTFFFIQLAVIPKLKLTDRGLVDVSKQRFVSLFL